MNIDGKGQTCSQPSTSEYQAIFSEGLKADENLFVLLLMSSSYWPIHLQPQFSFPWYTKHRINPPMFGAQNRTFTHKNHKAKLARCIHSMQSNSTVVRMLDSLYKSTYSIYTGKPLTLINALVMNMFNDDLNRHCSSMECNDGNASGCLHSQHQVVYCRIHDTNKELAMTLKEVLEITDDELVEDNGDVVNQG